MDNLGSHKGKAVRQAIRAVGAKLIFLPKYSPDLNPVEQVFGFPVRLTDSVSFPDVTSLVLFSGAAAVVDNPGGVDPGTATTDDYTVLLVPAAVGVPPSDVPEPATIAVLGAGLLGLVRLTRRD